MIIMDNGEQKSVRSEIIGELYRTLVLLGADSGLLGTVGSWGDSLPDTDVLSNLKAWNEASFAEVKGRIGHYEKSCIVGLDDSVLG
jgi:hypothetical protein